MDLVTRRVELRRLLDVALAAVDPERLTRDALSGIEPGPTTLIAIGKAAPAMCRGAAQALGDIEGICVTHAAGEVPDGIELVLGDHPLPGDRSFEAGRRVLETATRAQTPIIALISGGGSSLCEQAIDGVSAEYIREVNRTLLEQGAPIDDTNLIRSHLSRLKGGGLARAAATPVTTYALSDVCGADPRVIASGPTVQMPRDPHRAIASMRGHGIGVSAQIEEAIRAMPDVAIQTPPMHVIGDGRTASAGLVEAANRLGLAASAQERWLQDDVGRAMDVFLGDAGPGISVATGEPVVEVTGEGRGGRATHAALTAAVRLAGGEALFAALATDGTDGNSSAAGAIVDGTTIARADGDPVQALRNSDSAGYLERAGDLLITGPTGTNVSDLWVLWS